ncbi:sugar ABC transporter substrate-binding protein [Acidisoma cellulosilytica]|uniref:Sugar ABC transporter substrate-binding protein n=1 Tax=Acidisoma cellulosilyticum TaxID=2802395 RepID=A0A963Z245_9PROT|nr:sugar ABC transporter substrate-binding protein [Acidisoma cellulosilyticum]MCB8881452.1 sugar ABC transporter substrate-binding protein [Acidisoma cellulosilyticum]
MSRLKCLSAGLVCAVALGLTGAPRADAAHITLNVWTIDLESQYMFPLAKQFEALHPDITVHVKHVQFQDINNDLARASITGDVPDISYIDNPYIDLFGSRGLLLDLAPMIAQSKMIDLSKFYPGPLAAVKYGDKIYGIPRGANTLALYYNADKFKAAGLDPNKPPRTWAELYADAKTLTDPAKHVYGLAFSAVASEEGTFQFLPWIQMAGGDYNRLNTPNDVEALQFWQKLIDEKLASPDTLVRSQYDSTATFNAGDAAMAISGPWELPRMAKDAKFDYRVALLPTMTAGSAHVSALGEGDNVILAKSQHPKEAFELLEFLNSKMPSVWNDWGFLPVEQVTVDHPNWPADYALFLQALQTARVRGPSPHWADISQAIQTAVQAALTHQATAAQALATAQQSVDATVNQ